MDMLSKRLKHLRLQNGKYQKELAYHLKVTVGTVSNYENGIHQPDLNTIAHIANFYGVTVDYLLRPTDCPCPIDDINQVFTERYSMGRLMQLLTILPEVEKKFLVHMFCLLEHRYVIRK